ncbi:LytR/AlgR family response regulator transcription factor [Larkinella soli]|uniref:LytR/AlgR family response regulator transcription factor n=1 Tax=Larkinella soli TaxID=1770527 RepID=UPI000FFC4B28|nr:LytTR family DNA-binding domain-containing protein [Larkinella soli]
MTISALIIDDESLARDVIRLFLKSHPAVQVVGECENGSQAVEAIRKWQPDLVFLDVQMPEKDGFEVLKELGGPVSSVFIFVTAYDRYALRAFEVHAFDYLLKPFEQARFDEALKRALNHLSDRKATQINQRLLDLLADYEHHRPSPRPAYLQRLPIRASGRILFLKTHDIDWLEAAGDYLCLHAGPATHLLSETLTGLEQKLDPTAFVRIHRSVMVNVDRIAELIPHFNGEYFVVLKNGTRLKLSRTYRENLQNLLGGSL